MKKFFRGVLDIILIAFALWFLYKGGCSAANRLTYLEYQYVNDVRYVMQEEYVEISEKDCEIVQEFESPYDLIRAIHFKVRDEEFDNNSCYRVSLIQLNDEKIVADVTVCASGITDYLIVDFGKNIALHRGEKIAIQIRPTEISLQTPLAFAVTDGNDTDGMVMGGEKQDVSLSFKIYGGERDNWWLGFYLLLITGILLLAVYAYRIKRKQKSPLANKKFCAFLVMIGVFFLMAPYMSVGNFGDEYDNMQGGMLIAKGSVLYRDYVTQHTPFMYYLCALFAKFGAESVQQFRLCWYLLNGVIWGGVYYRYADDFGRKRMFILPIINILYAAMLYKQGMMVLSDNMQGLCMVILLLEFLQYRRSRSITISRAFIVAFSAVISVGVAFVSLYAIFILVVGLFLFEFDFWKQQSEKAASQIIKAAVSRYTMLIVSSIILLGLPVLYFYMEGALNDAYDMAYRFNIEVYPQYIGVIGENKLQPFYMGIKSFFETVFVSINNLVGNNPGANVGDSADTIGNSIRTLFILVIMIGIFVKFVLNRQMKEGTILFLFLCSNATRGMDTFHSLPFWYVASALAVLFVDNVNKKKDWNKKVCILEGCAIIYLAAPYVMGLGENIFKTQEPISELQQEVIAHTQENEGILIDTGLCNAVYFCAKERYPINRNTFFLPWYFDWYEQETIADLKEYMPRVAVYAPGRWIWNEKHFDSAFEQTMKEEYQQFSYDPDDEWMYQFWMRK